MRILHYMPGFPPVHSGGMVRYAIDLIRQESMMGHEVAVLIPGHLPKNRDRMTKIREVKSRRKQSAEQGRIRIFEIYNPQPVPMGYGMLDLLAFMKACGEEPYREFLGQNRPELIHMHTLMGIHREFLLAAKDRKIPIVYTTHDYFGLCPMGNLFCDGQICRIQSEKNCWKCCQNAYSGNKLRLVHARAYRKYRKCRLVVRAVHSESIRKFFRTEKDAGFRKMPGMMEDEKRKGYSALRDYYKDLFCMVSIFHFNSSTARDVYQSWLGNIKGQVIPVSHRQIRDRRCKRSYAGRLRIGYFGNWSMHKGFFALMNACEGLYRGGRTDMELHVYSDSDRRAECFVKNHPLFKWQELGDVMDTIDVLAVPSLWAETFGLVALEALSYGVPSVISQNAGVKDLLEHDQNAGFLYDGTQSGLEQTLRNIYDHREMLEKANAAILHMNFDFSYETHVDKIIGMYTQMAGR